MFENRVSVLVQIDLKKGNYKLYEEDLLDKQRSSQIFQLYRNVSRVLDWLCTTDTEIVDLLTVI